MLPCCGFGHRHLDKHLATATISVAKAQALGQKTSQRPQKPRQEDQLIYIQIRGQTLSHHSDTCGFATGTLIGNWEA